MCTVLLGGRDIKIIEGNDATGRDIKIIEGNDATGRDRNHDDKQLKINQKLRE